ncbi:hypothetical protein PG989_007088 [Apiospora arundinis]
MSGATSLEHGSELPDDQATRSAVALSITFIILVFIGIGHFAHRKAVLRPLRTRRVLPTRRLRSQRALGEVAVGNIPMIKYEEHMPPPPPPPPPPSPHRSTFGIWLSQLRQQHGATDNATRSRPLLTRLRLVIRGRRCDGSEEEPTRPPTTCSICTEDFLQGEQLRNLSCGHLFHPACIDPWLCDRSRTCPLWYVDTRLRRRWSMHGSQS